MKKILMSFYLLPVFYLFQSCSGGTNDRQDPVDSAKTINKEIKPVAKDASDFAVKAAAGNMMEVEIGKLAQNKAVSQRVRDFGAMMVKDHSEANDQLKNLASALHIALPDSMSIDSKKEMDKLYMKKGKDFDKSYMDIMLADHQHDVAEFRKAADNLSDSTIKDFAAKTLLVLEKHLDSAKAITGKK